MIHSKEDLIKMIRQVGILPFFTNSVSGWSVEEHIDCGEIAIDRIRCVIERITYC